MSDEGTTRFQVVLQSATLTVISKICLPWVNRGYCSFALIWFHRTGSDFPPPKEKHVPINPTLFRATGGLEITLFEFYFRVEGKHRPL